MGRMASNVMEYLDKKPRLAVRSSKAFIIFVVSYAIFVDQFVFAVIVPVMPFALHQHVGVPDTSVQYWISVLLSIYGVATFLASPPWGWYSDRKPSRRIPFLLSLFVVFGATVMIWRASSITLQIVGRILQGCAAAFVWITGLAMIADAVGHRNVGQAVGYLSMAMMIGTLVAPLVGGVVLARAGYDAVFEVTLGLIALDIVLRFIMIEPHAVQTDSTSEETLEEVPVTNSQTSEKPSHHSLTIKYSPTWSRRYRLPPIVTLLSSKRLLAALLGTLVEGAIFSGLETVLPLETQAVFNWNSEGAGLIFLPLTLTAFLGPLVGRICDNYGPRYPILFGFLIQCPCLTLLRFVDHNTMQQKVLLCVLLTLIGCCITLTVDPLMAEIVYSVEEKAKDEPERYQKANAAYAQAFALFNMAFSVGNTVGPLCAGLVRDAAGWGTMSWALGLLSGVTAVPTGLWCGGWILRADARWSGEKEAQPGPGNFENEGNNTDACP